MDMAGVKGDPQGSSLVCVKMICGGVDELRSPGAIDVCNVKERSRENAS
jgi:hypothetical protein